MPQERRSYSKVSVWQTRSPIVISDCYAVVETKHESQPMSTSLTEDEMRKALFGSYDVPAQGAFVEPEAPEMIFVPPSLPSKKKRSSSAFTPRLRVVLSVGNEFEGAMQELVHEADTLSTLLAEQEAVRSAKKKFRYVEVISVKPM